MRVRLNGEAREVKSPTLGGVLEELGIQAGGVACELNTRVVRRAEYGKTVLKEGDAVEIVRMIGGGA